MSMPRTGLLYGTFSQTSTSDMKRKLPRGGIKARGNMKGTK
jgi:hypothetical protein